MSVRKGDTVKVETSPDEKQREGRATETLPGVVKELGELGAGAIITENGLARLLDRHPTSIKRAVSRGELPPSTRLLGGPVWTAGAIIAHIEKRLEAAAKEGERTAKKISELGP